MAIAVLTLGVLVLFSIQGHIVDGQKAAVQSLVHPLLGDPHGTGVLLASQSPVLVEDCDERTQTTGIDHLAGACSRHYDAQQAQKEACFAPHQFLAQLGHGSPELEWNEVLLKLRLPHPKEEMSFPDQLCQTLRRHGSETKGSTGHSSPCRALYAGTALVILRVAGGSEGLRRILSEHTDRITLVCHHTSQGKVHFELKESFLLARQPMTESEETTGNGESGSGSSVLPPPGGTANEVDDGGRCVAGHGYPLTTLEGQKQQTKEEEQQLMKDLVERVEKEWYAARRPLGVGGEEEATRSIVLQSEIAVEDTMTPQLIVCCRLNSTAGSPRPLGSKEKALARCVTHAATELSRSPLFYFVTKHSPVKQVHNKFSRGLLQSGHVGAEPFGASLDLKGSGIVVGVADTGIDTDHCFFHDPAVPVPYDSFNANHRKFVRYRTYPGHSTAQDGRGDTGRGGHGTHVCGTVAGSMVSEAAAQNPNVSAFHGVLSEGKLTFTDIGTDGEGVEPPNDLSQMFNQAKADGAQIHSNSWGDVMAQYTTQCRAVDDYIHRQNSDMLIIFSAGNEADKNCVGKADSVLCDKFTVVSPSTGKNVLSVGASMAPYESWKAAAQANYEMTIKPVMGNPFTVVAAKADFGPKHPELLQNVEVILAEPYIGCPGLRNSAQVRGRAILIQRGGTNCFFDAKAKYGQDAGAVAVIIVNHLSGDPIIMGGQLENGPVITIPTFMVSKTAGERLNLFVKGNAAGTYVHLSFNVTSEKNPHRDEENLSAFSSRGPTFDFRFKPDIIAVGEFVHSAYSDGQLTTYNCNLWPSMGTSMSAPLIAGLSGTVQEYFKKGLYPLGQKPTQRRRFATAAGATEIPVIDATMTKAILIHSAAPLRGQYDRNSEGDWLSLGSHSPSFAQGHGFPRLNTTLPVNNNGVRLYLATDTLSSQEEKHYCVRYTEEEVRLGLPFRAVLVWADLPGTPATHFQLINNLDLTVVTPNGTKYRGNMGASEDVVQGRDAVNNVEKVTILPPGAGHYLVLVTGPVVDGTQNYKLVASGVIDPSGCPASTCEARCVRGHCVNGLCHCEAGGDGSKCDRYFTTLAPGESVTSRVLAGAWEYFLITVPNVTTTWSGAPPSLRLRFGALSSGSKGDPDLYVQRGVPPVMSGKGPGHGYFASLTHCDNCSPPRLPNSDEAGVSLPADGSTYFVGVIGMCCATARFRLTLAASNTQLKMPSVLSFNGVPSLPSSAPLVGEKHTVWFNKEQVGPGVNWSFKFTGTFYSGQSTNNVSVAVGYDRTPTKTCEVASVNATTVLARCEMDFKCERAELGRALSFLFFFGQSQIIVPHRSVIAMVCSSSSGMGSLTPVPNGGPQTPEPTAIGEEGSTLSSGSSSASTAGTPSSSGFQFPPTAAPGSLSPAGLAVDSCRECLYFSFLLYPCEAVQTGETLHIRGPERWLRDVQQVVFRVPPENATQPSLSSVSVPCSIKRVTFGFLECELEAGAAPTGVPLELTYYTNSSIGSQWVSAPNLKIEFAPEAQIEGIALELAAPPKLQLNVAPLDLAVDFSLYIRGKGFDPRSTVLPQDGMSNVSTDFGQEIRAVQVGPVSCPVTFSNDTLVICSLPNGLTNAADVNQTSIYTVVVSSHDFGKAKPFPTISVLPDPLIEGLGSEGVSSVSVTDSFEITIVGSHFLELQGPNKHIVVQYHPLSSSVNSGTTAGTKQEPSPRAPSTGNGTDASQRPEQIRLCHPIIVNDTTIVCTVDPLIPRGSYQLNVFCNVTHTHLIHPSLTYSLVKVHSRTSDGLTFRYDGNAPVVTSIELVNSLDQQPSGIGESDAAASSSRADGNFLRLRGLNIRGIPSLMVVLAGGPMGTPYHSDGQAFECWQPEEGYNSGLQSEASTSTGQEPTADEEDTVTCILSPFAFGIRTPSAYYRSSSGGGGREGKWVSCSVVMASSRSGGGSLSDTATNQYGSSYIVLPQARLPPSNVAANLNDGALIMVGRLPPSNVAANLNDGALIMVGLPAVISIKESNAPSKLAEGPTCNAFPGTLPKTVDSWSYNQPPTNTLLNVTFDVPVDVTLCIGFDPSSTTAIPLWNGSLFYYPLTTISVGGLTKATVRTCRDKTLLKEAHSDRRSGDQTASKPFISTPVPAVGGQPLCLHLRFAHLPNDTRHIDLRQAGSFAECTALAGTQVSSELPAAFHVDREITGRIVHGEWTDINATAPAQQFLCYRIGLQGMTSVSAWLPLVQLKPVHCRLSTDNFPSPDCSYHGRCVADEKKREKCSCGGSFVGSSCEISCPISVGGATCASRGKCNSRGQCECFQSEDVGLTCEKRALPLPLISTGSNNRSLQQHGIVLPQRDTASTADRWTVFQLTGISNTNPQIIDIIVYVADHSAQRQLLCDLVLWKAREHVGDLSQAAFFSSGTEPLDDGRYQRIAIDVNTYQGKGKEFFVGLSFSEARAPLANETSARFVLFMIGAFEREGATPTGLGRSALGLPEMEHHQADFSSAKAFSNSCDSLCKATYTTLALLAAVLVLVFYSVALKCFR